jgi:hypothetical protein
MREVILLQALSSVVGPVPCSTYQLRLIREYKVTIVLKNRTDKPIASWQDWTRPKRDYQWKAGRSAMELARSWFRLGTPFRPSSRWDWHGGTAHAPC